MLHTTILESELLFFIFIARLHCSVKSTLEMLFHRIHVDKTALGYIVVVGRDLSCWA